MNAELNVEGFELRFDILIETEEKLLSIAFECDFGILLVDLKIVLGLRSRHSKGCEELSDNITLSFLRT